MPEGSAPKDQIDVAAITKSATEAAVKAVSEQFAKTVGELKANQKVLADTLASDAAAKKEAEAKAAEAGKGKPEPLTTEAAQKLISDGVKAALEQRDQAAQSNAARNSFIGEKLKDVPAIYHGKLGSDPAKWPAEEQAIREELKGDLAKLGATVKDVRGDNAGGAGTGATTTTSPKVPAGAGLTPGQADFAGSLKLPATTGAAAN